MWSMVLVVALLGHLTLCLAWPPECLVEVALPCTVDRESLLNHLPEDVPVDAVQVPFWTPSWTAPQQSGEGVVCSSMGPDGEHLVSGRMEWEAGSDCQLKASWRLHGVPLHLRGFGVLFGAQAQMEDALIAWLEAWGQGAAGAEAP